MRVVHGMYDKLILTFENSEFDKSDRIDRSCNMLICFKSNEVFLYILYTFTVIITITTHNDFTRFVSNPNTGALGTSIMYDKYKTVKRIM